ncbi:MAG TPA: hypothetical protein VFB34_10450, partial [Chloroflexota bacterium]|nr:hypothetical protein [Chloroflexota bacterium]
MGAAAIFGLIFLVAAVPVFDADLWWHLFTGAHIVASGSVPSSDLMSFTYHGRPWVDHEWLSEVMLFSVYRIAGLQLVVGLFGLVIAGAFFVMYLTMRLRSVNPLLALVLTAALASTSIGTWGPRVQMISLLFTAIFCYLLERYRLSGRRSLLVPLPLLMLLWCNLHGGFAIGLAVMLLYALGGMLERVLERDRLRSAIGAERPLVVALAAAIVVSFVNPNGLRTVLYPLSFLTPNAFTNSIQESQSPNFHLTGMLPFEALLLMLLA